MGYNRENYYLLAVDKESDFLYSIPSVERANAYLLLKEYLNATGFRPLRLRCDNAPEFKSSDFVAFSTGQLLTPFERVKPKNLSNRLSDVFVPFGCKAIGILPKEHPLIKNTSHQNRGFEGIFLRKDDRSEQVWLYVFALRKRMLFHDAHYYKSQFPFRDHGCLSNPKLMDATAVDF